MRSVLNSDWGMLLNVSGKFRINTFLFPSAIGTPTSVFFLFPKIVFLLVHSTERLIGDLRHLFIMPPGFFEEGAEHDVFRFTA